VSPSATETTFPERTSAGVDVGISNRTVIVISSSCLIQYSNLWDRELLSRFMEPNYHMKGTNTISFLRLSLAGNYNCR
jgi:hypothetical protein